MQKWLFLTFKPHSKENSYFIKDIVVSTIIGYK